MQRNIPKDLDFLNEIAPVDLNIDLTNDEGFAKLILWWVARGVGIYKNIEWELENKDYELLSLLNLTLLSPKLVLLVLEAPIIKENFFVKIRKYITENIENVPRYLSVIKSQRPDLKEKFGSSVEEYIDWYSQQGKNEYPFLSAAVLNNCEKVHNKKKSNTLENNIHVNLYGLFHEEKGVAEDARLICDALELVGIIVNKCTPSFLTNFQSRPILNAINIYVLPPIEYVRHKMSQAASERTTMTGYNIGIFPWELPTWPSKYQSYFNDINEIWAPSIFIKNTFEKFKQKTFHVNYPVVLPKYKKITKKSLGINDNSYIFFIAFDVFSWFTRKNPWVGIKAFINKFANSSGAHLLIKLNNYKINAIPSEDITELENICKKHKNITLILKNTNRSQFISLLDVSDCLISTHSSEGFGRIIAEAMLLKKDVVVSNYSGNTDFCNEETSYLIEGAIGKITSNDYPLGGDSEWYFPSIKSCEEMLYQAYQNRNCNKKRDCAFELVTKNYSLVNIANIYRRLFEGILDVYE